MSRVVLAPRTTRRSSIDARGVVDDRVCELVRSRGQDARVSVCTGRRTPPRPRPVGFFSQPEMDRVGAMANAASRAAPTPLTRVPKMSRIFSSVIQNAPAFRARHAVPSRSSSSSPRSSAVAAARPRPLEHPIDDVEEVRGGRVRLRGEKHRPAVTLEAAPPPSRYPPGPDAATPRQGPADRTPPLLAPPREARRARAPKPTPRVSVRPRSVVEATAAREFRRASARESPSQSSPPPPPKVWRRMKRRRDRRPRRPRRPRRRCVSSWTPTTNAPTLPFPRRRRRRRRV